MIFKRGRGKTGMKQTLHQQVLFHRCADFALPRLDYQDLTSTPSTFNSFFF